VVAAGQVGEEECDCDAVVGLGLKGCVGPEVSGEGQGGGEVGEAGPPGQSDDAGLALAPVSEAVAGLPVTWGDLGVGDAEEVQEGLPLAGVEEEVLGVEEHREGEAGVKADMLYIAKYFISRVNIVIQVIIGLHRVMSRAPSPGVGDAAGDVEEGGAAAVAGVYAQV